MTKPLAMRQERPKVEVEEPPVAPCGACFCAKLYGVQSTVEQIARSSNLSNARRPGHKNTAARSSAS